MNYDKEEGRTTRNDGRIWTDKSVYTGKATVLKDQSETMDVTKSSNSDFLVGLSALSSTMKVDGVSEKPLDIIMVLDVSGSMSEDMGYEAVYADEMTAGNTYYVKNGQNYIELSYGYQRNQWYYGTRNNYIWITPKESADDTTSGAVQVYKKVTKIEVLSDSVKNFVDYTKEINATTAANKQHRISIVKFSGNISNTTGNTTYNQWDNNKFNTYNHSQVVKEFVTPVDNATVTELNNAVDSLTPAGATRADNGMKVAEGVMDDVRSNAQSVVIFFTDGVPTTFSTWSDDVANAAIGSAKNMKDAGAWIYSVGVFEESVLSGNEDLHNYMNAVSSNYPNATGFTNNALGEGDTDKGYYNTADDADSLKAIFEKIAQAIIGKVAELPTHVEEGYDAEKGGYVIFVDKLGDYMEVSSVNSVVYEGVEYANKITSKVWESAASDTDVFVNDVEVKNDLGKYVSIGSVVVTVDRSDDARTGDIVTVKVPAALVPLAYYNVSVTDERAVTERIPTTPIRAFYEVSLKDEARELLENPDEDMIDYLSTHTDENGQALFYSNAYEKDANAEIGSTVASFVPSKMNDMYYAVDDTLIFADEDCTQPVTTINESATYYYQRVYYVESDKPVAPKYETVAFSASVLRNVDYDFTDDGQLYVKAGEGRYTRADAVDTVKAANETSTAAKAAAPRWTDWYVEGSAVPVYLGNNGLLKKDVPGTLAISKDVVVPAWSKVDLAETEFSFKVTLENYDAELIKEFNAQIKDADGNNVGDAFTITPEADGSATVTLQADQTVYVYGLPEGVTYKVKEENIPDGFSQTAPADDSGQLVLIEGEIEAGKISTAAFENTYSATGTLEGEANLDGTKKLVGRDWRESDVFAFALVPENTNNPMPEGAKKVNDIYMSLVTVEGEADQEENVLKSFHFGDIVYTEPGTYLYDIREIVVDGTADRVPGISYSQVVYEVTVNVTDQGNGMLKVTSTMRPFGSTEEVETAKFKNNYVEESVDFAFRGIKELNDTTDAYELADDMFTFKLTPITKGAPMPESAQDGFALATNKGVTINFDTINCSKSEADFVEVEKIVYEYKVEEVTPENTIPGMVYDKNSYEIQVELTWSDTDGLVFNIIYPDADNKEDTKETWVNFVNTYDPEDVKVELEGVKVLTGRDWTDGDKFEFVLKGLDGAPMPKDSQGSEYTFQVEKVNEASKLGVFGTTIKYDKPGTYNYTLSEVAGNAGGMTYDNHVSNITVEVTDDNGVLKADKTVEVRTDLNVNIEDMDKVSVFVNKYEAEMAYPGLTVEKTLYGRDMTFGEFDFVIEAANDNAKEKGLAETDASFESGAHPDGETCVNDGKLSSLVFTQSDDGKEFIYKVSEVLPEEDDDTVHDGIQKDKVTYDESVYWVVIVPTDNGDGTMSVETKIYDVNPTAEGVSPEPVWPAENEEVPTISFENEYGFKDVTIDTKANAFFTKIFEGRDWLDTDTFEFKLSVADGSPEETPLPGNTTVTVGKPESGNQAVVDFGEITYIEAGTYIYEVTETAGDISGVTYDTHTATLTVTVTGNGKEKLTVSTSVENGEFTNQFKDEVTYGDVTTLDVTKSLEGRELRERQFDFTVVPVDIPSMRKAGMSTLEGIRFRNGGPDADGISHMFSPDGLKFTEDDLGITYAYIFSEEKGDITGYTYDENVYTLEMTALYEDGKMKVVTKVTDQDGNVIADVVGYENMGEIPVVTIAFKNSYEAKPTSATAEGTKAMTGRDQVADEFEFVAAYAADDDKTPVANATNDANGKVEFDKFTYTLDELEKLIADGYATKKADGMTDIYTISYVAYEKAGDKAGVTHTASSFAFTVTVTDDGEGRLTSEVNYPESGLAFENAYNVDPIEYNVRGLKVLKSSNGLTPDSIEGKFTFELTAVTEDAPMPANNTATNDAYGNIDFGVVKFHSSDLNGVEQQGKVRTKEFVYAVKETGEAAGVINDPVDTKTFTVTLTDDGEGNLTVTADPLEGPLFTFENTYGAKEVTESITGEGNLTVTKKLEGRTLKDGEFQFELLDNGSQKVVARGTNDSEGKVTFDAVTYERIGTYTYTVREAEGNVNGITYDDTTYQVKAVVTDNGKGQLEVEFSILNENVEVMEFTNEYKACDTSITVNFAKVLEGRSLKDGEFEFKMTAVTEDAPMPELDVVTNTAAGEVNFGQILYDKEGTWEYTIAEIKGNIENVTYDEMVHTMKVIVTDNNDGQLTAEVTFDGTKEVPVFVNQYDASEEVEVPSEPEKPADGNDSAKTGDNANIITYLFALLASLIVAFVALIVRRRNSYRR